MPRLQTGSKPSFAPRGQGAAPTAVAPSEVPSFVVIEQTLEDVDLLALARAADCLPQLGWFDEGTGAAWLGLGSVDEVLAQGAPEAREAADLCRARLARVRVPDEALREHVRYFGGLAFDPESPPHPAWPAGASARFVLPELIVWQPHGSTQARVLAVAARERDVDEADAETRLQVRLRELARWQEVAGRLPAGRLAARRIEMPAARSHWKATIQQALTELGPAEKVVLSRDVCLASREPIDPWVVLQRLARTSPGHRFCFRYEPEAAFLGATPERLVSIEGLVVRSDGLAGTIRRGQTPGEDLALASQLLESEKDRREHQFVVDAIQAALTPLCASLELSATPSVLRTPTVQHLHTPILGHLHPGVGLSELLGRLYPTPAVCGTPREHARQAIRRLEDRPRGWYAGAVGWISSEAADFAVGIRSAIVHAQGAIVFCGGGIVAGSDPDAEFEETERKAMMLVSLLEGCPS